VALVVLQSLVVLVLPVALVALVVLQSLVVLVLPVVLELPALVVPELLLVALEPLMALVVLQSLVVLVLLLVAVESLVTLEVNDWIIASACDSADTIGVALAIIVVKELMEEDMVLEESITIYLHSNLRNYFF
jgi:hypothetical protein